MKNLFLYLLIILKNVIYGSTILFTSKLLDSTNTLDVLSIRFIISSAFFVLLIITKSVKINLKGKKLGLILLTALFEPVLEFIFETIGISATSNITAGLITASAPIVNVIIQFFILKEKTNFRQLICILCGVVGLFYIVVKTTSAVAVDKPYGILCMLLAVLFGAMYFSFSRKTSQSEDFSSTEITCISSVVGMVVFNTVNLVRHIIDRNITNYFMPLFSFENIIGFIVLGILSSVCAVIISNYALSKLPPIRISIFSGISTIVTIALGIIVNHEQLHFFHIIGILLIFIGIIGVNYFSEKNQLHNIIPK